MKRSLAILLVALMVISLTACKSKEQQAADDFVKEFEEKADAIIAAYEDNDWAEMQELGKEVEEMGTEYEQILEDLEKADEEAAEQFKEDVEEIADKLEALD